MTNGSLTLCSHLSLCPQLIVMQRFSMKCCLMKNSLEVSTSGDHAVIKLNKVHALHSTAECFCVVFFFFFNRSLPLILRCTSPRGYRVPPCALINLSHGARGDPISHKLTAIVKPQPAAATNHNSQRQLGGLNHSPRSPFIPTQVRREPQQLLPFGMQSL